MKLPVRLNSGLVVGLLTLGATSALLVTAGGSMFSPGGLKAQGRTGATLGGVRSHAGITQCAACHAPPWSSETMADRCLACHTDIQQQIDTRQAIHGTLGQGRECRSCHTEHKGDDGVLTDLARFDHDCAAFKLTGKHQTVNCKSCHKAGVYRSTPQTCAACHAEPQVHKGRFGTKCSLCHDTNTWHTGTVQPGTVALVGFNHDVTGFKLTGKHAGLDCKSCHVNNAFKGLSTTCAACHAEPQEHKGRFGNNCVQCHSTNSWTGASFQHSFPLNHGLRGRQNSSCATCHPVANDFKTYTCYGCHRHDLEQEQRRHPRVDAVTLQKCAHCHPNGREHRRGKENRRGKEKRRADGGVDALKAVPVCLACAGMTRTRGGWFEGESDLFSDRTVDDVDWRLRIAESCFPQLRTSDAYAGRDGVLNRLERALSGVRLSQAHSGQYSKTPGDPWMIQRESKTLWFDRKPTAFSKAAD
jgi:hypothetical protein